MGTYSFQLQKLEGAVTNAQQVSKQVKSLLDELDSAVKSKLAVWTGDARQTYDQCKAQWDQSAANMPIHLHAAGQTLESIAEQYDSAEKAAIDAFFG